MIVFGASGHAKVVIEILEVNGITDIEVWDDGADKTRVWQYPVKKPSLQGSSSLEMVIGVGRNDSRKNIAGRFSALAKFITSVHTSAVISPRAIIDEGTVVMAGVAVNADTRVGKHCIVNTCASIDHDCLLEDYVHISPNATLSGNVSIGEGTHIGAGATVIQGITIGKWCTIGAGAVVIRPVPDYATVVGNPGRIIKIDKPQQ
jgi:sugar O-acyltransferase (sialic acid O-acetyltransferase NeuD family)